MMKYQIRRLWGGVAPVLTTNQIDAGLADASFNDLLTKAAVAAYDQYINSTASQPPSEEPEVLRINENEPSSRRRRRRRQSQGLTKAADVRGQNNNNPSSLTPNDRFFEHQRTRGYRLATKSISSCESARRLEEECIVDAMTYYLDNAIEAKLLAKQLSSAGAGGELSIDMWAAVQRGFGAHHRDHVHEGAIVSGVYYSAVPLESAPLVLRRPGTACLNEQEQTDTSDTGIDTDEGDVIITPKEGQLILFPPWLLHGVPPVDDEQQHRGGPSNLPRVSYAFNLTGRFAALGDPWDITRPSFTKQ